MIGSVRVAVQSMRAPIRIMVIAKILVNVTLESVLSRSAANQAINAAEAPVTNVTFQSTKLFEALRVEAAIERRHSSGDAPPEAVKQLREHGHHGRMEVLDETLYATRKSAHRSYTVVFSSEYGSSGSARAFVRAAPRDSRRQLRQSIRTMRDSWQYFSDRSSRE